MGAAAQQSSQDTSRDQQNPVDHIITSTISWPPHSERDTVVRSLLSTEALAKVDSASLPVLLPRNIEHLDEAKIRVSSNVFSASLSNPDLGLSAAIVGKRSFFVPASGSPQLAPLDDQVRGVPAAIRRSEGAIWSLTWEQYGASYLLKLSCDDSVTDKCEDDSYLRSLAESLVFVGGDFAISRH
jgi:hypothetical protein